jgi:hypothetical protein
LVVYVDDQELSLHDFGRMLTTYAGWGEVCRNLGDAVDQAAWLAGISMTSTPFWNLTPWTTLGN